MAKELIQKAVMQRATKWYREDDVTRKEKKTDSTFRSSRKLSYSFNPNWTNYII